MPRLATCQSRAYVVLIFWMPAVNSNIESSIDLCVEKELIDGNTYFKKGTFLSNVGE